MIPKFIYEARREHYKFWELSRIARNKYNLFSYADYDVISDINFIRNIDGSQTTLKNNLLLEKLETIENPLFEEYVRTYKDIQC